MKLGRIVNAVPALQKVASTDLSLSVLYRVGRLMDSLEKQLDFYNEQRDTALAKYGTETETEPGRWLIASENLPAYEARMAELLDVEVDDVSPVRIPVCENLRLSYNDLSALQGFVELEGAEE